MRIHLRKKYAEMPAAVKTSVWFAVCQFLQRGISFITVPIFTRLLTTEEYGICNIYFAWFEVFLLFTSLKIPYEGLNNGLIRYEKDKDGYTSSVMGLIMVMTAGGGIIYFIFRKWLDQIVGLNSFIVKLMFIQLMFNPPLMLWINKKRFDFHYKKPVIVTIVSTFLNLVVTIAAVISTSYKAEARIISSVFIQAFFGIIFVAVLLAKGRTFYKKEYWKFALGFNLPLIFYYVSQIILNQSDRILINYFQGSGKAAVYSVAHSAATLMLLLFSAINGSFNPWMYKKLKVKKFGDVKRNVSMLCLAVGGMTFGVSILAPNLVGILATEAYMEAIWIIAPISASMFFVFLYMIFANVEMYYGENKGISAISILCSALNIVLNIIFIPRFGYFAAGWTTLFSYVVLTILHYLLMRRACNINHISEKIFQDKILLLISGGVILLSFGAMLLYRTKYFRYAFLAGGVILIFLFKEKLMAFWMRTKEASGDE